MMCHRSVFLPSTQRKKCMWRTSTRLPVGAMSRNGPISKRPSCVPVIVERLATMSPSASMWCTSKVQIGERRPHLLDDILQVLGEVRPRRLLMILTAVGYQLVDYRKVALVEHLLKTPERQGLVPFFDSHVCFLLSLSCSYAILDVVILQ